MPTISERGELFAARVAAAGAVVVAGYFGVNPPGFVAQVVAFAFGLAASSFFPAIVLGIFWTRANREGVVTGMLAGIGFTASYIVYFKFLGGTAEGWWLDISPEGIGAVGMVINFVIAVGVSLVTPPPPDEVAEMVQRIRIPGGATGPSGGH
jgi:cation/acetate symporter